MSETGSEMDQKPTSLETRSSFTHRPKRPRWHVLVLVAVIHIAVLYGLAKALTPDLVRSVEQSVVSTFNVTITAPPPEDNIPEPDEGSAGSAGKDAVPQPQSAPTPKVPRPPERKMPEASSTGSATTSGARNSGDGTGASGTGSGTGSGNQGSGQGGVAVSKPVHISGAINNARDYPVPEGGRETRKGTEVIVKVTVGVDGRARNCSIVRASPDPEADAITCRLVEQRLGFRPAMDASGNPVPAPFYWRQRWF